MAQAADIVFTDNPVIRGRESHYAELTVDAARIVESWRLSLFAYEWLEPDGRIRRTEDLPAKEQPRRAEVEKRLEKSEPLEKPVLGIGMLDNIEIGSGRAVFLTLAARGVRAIPVHVPKSHVDEFAAYLT